MLSCFYFPFYQIMKILIKILLSGIAIFVVTLLVPGAEAESLWSAILAGIVISLVNGFLGTLLRILTFPLNILTLGLVSFTISVLMIMLAGAMVPGFNTGGFLGTALFAILLSLVNMVLGVNKND